MSSIGIGIFSLHHIFETTGIVWGCLTSVLVGFSLYFNAKLLTYSVDEVALVKP